jgi:hypothetical protein
LLSRRVVRPEIQLDILEIREVRQHANHKISTVLNIESPQRPYVPGPEFQTMEVNLSLVKWLRIT